MPLLQIPPPFVAKNNKSAVQDSAFVESAISELFKFGVYCGGIHTSSSVKPIIPFHSEVGKKSLILDLRHVNKYRYLFKSKFRCKDMSIAREVLDAGDFMFSFALKSGYHVEIFPGHRQYLSFSWTFSSSHTRLLHFFSVLPFGISSAPYLFTKILKPLVKKWRSVDSCLSR